jgi:hypothetical protein
VQVLRNAPHLGGSLVGIVVVVAVGDARDAVPRQACRPQPAAASNEVLGRIIRRTPRDLNKD